ncbi:MAG: hypothetical protein JNL35_08375 [Sphingopyxis sp.]|nr:hypothetical protein [Sphingopyxis sp.]
MPDDRSRPASTTLYRTGSLAVLMLAATFGASPSKANDGAELDLARLHLFPSEAIRVGETKKRKSFDSNRRISSKSYPVALSYGDASVTVLGYDSNSETMTYRVDKNLIERPAGVQWVTSSGYLG